MEAFASFKSSGPEYGLAWKNVVLVHLYHIIPSIPGWSETAFAAGNCKPACILTASGAPLEYLAGSASAVPMLMSFFANSRYAVPSRFGRVGGGIGSDFLPLADFTAPTVASYGPYMYYL